MSQPPVEGEDKQLSPECRTELDAAIEQQREAHEQAQAPKKPLPEL